MDELEPGDYLVARGWSWSAEKLQESARRDLRDQQAFGEANPVASVSVFAMVHDGTEDLAALKDRLAAHVSSNLNSRYIGFTSVSKLGAQGFKVRLNEPPQHHYDILTPDLDDIALFKTLSEAFQDRRKAA